MCRKNHIVHITKRIYDYDDMRKDIWNLWKRYPEFCQVQILGKTLEKRNMYCIRLGSRKAKRNVIVNGAMHGREWLNTQLLMLLTERYLEKTQETLENGSCGRNNQVEAKRFQCFYEEVGIYVLPMVNPDGVIISQNGVRMMQKYLQFQNISSLKTEKYHLWKANARGVDLNRNFECGFGKNGVIQPGSKEYGGAEPLSEPESQALIRLVEEIKPVAVLNYHEAGSFILYREFSNLLFALHRTTGYPLQKESEGCPGSFGDWLTHQHIDWCTLETCRGKAPVGHWQIYPVYLRNRKILEVVAASAF